jgi:hypothetical protein
MLKTRQVSRVRHKPSPQSRHGEAEEAEALESKPDAIQLVRDAADLVSNHVRTLQSYGLLLSFLLYFSLWNAILLFHTDSSSTFAMKTAVEGAFFPKVEQFQEASQAFDWMEGTMLEHLFDDPVCGDGRCEGPVEYPAYGPNHRFGYSLHYTVLYRPHCL